MEDQSVMQQYQVQGFPTIKWFGENKSKPIDYNSSRDAKGMVNFALQKVGEIARGRIGLAGGSSSGGGSSGGSGGGSGDVVDLTDSNFDDKVIKDSKNMWY